jgi:hypothetical protein
LAVTRTRIEVELPDNGVDLDLAGGVDTYNLSDAEWLRACDPVWPMLHQMPGVLVRGRPLAGGEPGPGQLGGDVTPHLCDSRVGTTSKARDDMLEIARLEPPGLQDNNARQICDQSPAASIAIEPIVAGFAKGTTASRASLTASLDTRGTRNRFASCVASVVFPDPGNPLTMMSGATIRLWCQTVPTGFR